MLDLELEVVLLGLGPQLDLLELDLHLFLLGFGSSLLCWYLNLP